MKKKAYSLLFMVSLLTSLAQPVLPLMEYYIYQESIIELFCINKDHPEMHCDGHCYLNNRIKEMQEGKEFPSTLLALDHMITLFLPQSDLSGLESPPTSRDFPKLDQRYKSMIPTGTFHPPNLSLI